MGNPLIPLMSPQPTLEGFYVYVLFRPWNGQPCYVGKGRGGRIRTHARLGGKHYNPHLAAIFTRAGGDVPSVIVREGLSEKDAFVIEVALIAAIGREINGGPLANMTDGGEGSGGRRQSTAMKAACSETQRGRRFSDEHLQRLRDARRRRTISAETASKISAALKGRKPSPAAI